MYSEISDPVNIDHDLNTQVRLYITTYTIEWKREREEKRAAVFLKHTHQIIERPLCYYPTDVRIYRLVFLESRLEGEKRKEERRDVG